MHSNEDYDGCSFHSRDSAKGLMHDVFEAMDITADTAWHLFRLLDDSDDHRIDLDRFVEGCLRLQGAAKSTDIHMLMYESRWTLKKVDEIFRHVQESCSTPLQQQMPQGGFKTNGALDISELALTCRKALDSQGEAVPCYSI